MKQTESPYLISGTPMPSMSRFGPRSPFSCYVNTWGTLGGQMEIVWFAEIWHLKKNYDWMVIRGAGWQECIHLPDGRKLPASLAQLHCRLGRNENADEHCWQQQWGYNWLPVSGMAKHYTAYRCRPAVELHRKDWEIETKFFIIFTLAI